MTSDYIHYDMRDSLQKGKNQPTPGQKYIEKQSQDFPNQDAKYIGSQKFYSEPLKLNQFSVKSKQKNDQQKSQHKPNVQNKKKKLTKQTLHNGDLLKLKKEKNPKQTQQKHQIQPKILYREKQNFLFSENIAQKQKDQSKPQIQYREKQNLPLSENIQTLQTQPKDLVNSLIQSQVNNESQNRDFKGLSTQQGPSDNYDKKNSNDDELKIQIRPKNNQKHETIFRIEDEDVIDDQITNKLFSMVDSIEHKQGGLKFEDQDLAYLFVLLLNETRNRMRVMKDSFMNENDYLSHILPSFINENLAQIKMSCVEYARRYNDRNSALPLRFILSIDSRKTLLGKYLVIQAYEGDYDQDEDCKTWKDCFFSEYQDFKDSRNYVVQVLVKQRSKKHNSFEFIDLIGIIKKQKDDISYLIYLPWNKRVIDAFKIPNIEIKNSYYTGYDAEGIHKDLIGTYRERTYPNLEELYPDQFLSHVNPIMKPSTFLIEIKALMNAHKSPFLPLLLQPKVAKIQKAISEDAKDFQEGLSDTLQSFFNNHAINELYNNSQRRAMIDACNYNKPITIINGPPGTGKTFTSLGIMSAILQHMRQYNEKGLILACAHSNTVINDWVRKIAKASASENVNKKNGVPINTIINSKGEPQYVKVLRIGMSDKCDPDIFDYALDIKAQREFFNQNLRSFDKEDMNALFPNESPRNNCYSLTHVKRKILRINQQIQELKLTIQIFGQSIETAYAHAKMQPYKAQKKMLRALFFVMKELLTQKASEYRKIMSDLIQGAQIIVSTLTSSVSQILQIYASENKLPIQLLIIDEAPQCYEPTILTPLATHNVRKVVLIGDQKQLGPIIHDITNTVKNLYSRTLYERLMVTLPFFMLDVQYRSLPNLSALTSSIFYDNQVKDDFSVQNQQFPKYLNDLIKRSRNFIFFDLYRSQQQITTKKSYQNEIEARAVTLLVIYLIKKLRYQNEPSISVISPYSGQVQLIKEFLVYESKDEDIFKYVEVNTVDSFQGKENDIMIISLVRSEGIGFLKDPRRANVATSRAQYAQYIFGSKRALMQNKLWKNIYNYLDQANSVIKYEFTEIDRKFFEKKLNN